MSTPKKGPFRAIDLTSGFTPSPYEARLRSLEAQVKTLKREGQTLMDALALFADTGNWVGYDDDPGDFIFSCDKIKDPIEFASQVINSLK